MPHLTFSVRVPIEIRGSRQGPGDQNGRVDRRQLRLPRTPAGRDIKEMVKEATVAGGIPHRTVRSGPEEAQRVQRTFDRLCPRYERTFDRDRISGKGKSHAGYAGGDVVS